jgi:hypothetical protein
MINLPDRLAAMLAAETVETTVHALLTTEIRKALNDIFLLLFVLCFLVACYGTAVSRAAG